MSRPALILCVLTMTATAAAQPGAESAPEPYPGADGPPPAAGTPLILPPPPLRVEMSEEEREILLAGEISVGRYITGGVLSYALGFGIGQAAQGRWSDTGWMYTLGDTAAISTLVFGLGRCFEDEGGGGCSLAAAGLIGFGVLRIIQVVDAWVVPPRHNRRVRELRGRYRIDYAVPYRADLHFSPTSGGGFTGGVSLRF